MPVGIDLRGNLSVELLRPLCPASVESISRSPLQALFEVEVLETSTLFQLPNNQPVQNQRVAAAATTIDRRFVVHHSPIRRHPLVLLAHRRSNLLRNLEAPPGFEPGMEVLQI